MKTGISVDPMGNVEHHEFADSDLDNSNTQWIHDKIGGYLQIVPGVPASMFCNEDGQRLNLPVNYVASRIANQAILGTVVILGQANGRGDTTTVEPGMVKLVEKIAADWRGMLKGLDTLYADA